MANLKNGSWTVECFRRRHSFPGCWWLIDFGTILHEGSLLMILMSGESFRRDRLKNSVCSLGELLLGKCSSFKYLVMVFRLSRKTIDFYDYFIGISNPNVQSMIHEGNVWMCSSVKLGKFRFLDNSKSPECNRRLCIGRCSVACSLFQI